MTALRAPRPQDVYDAETVAGFRAAGYWRDETLSASVDRLAGQDRVLLTDGYSALTGAQLREQAYRLAAALRWLGVEAGDRVQVQLPNWNEFVVVYVALARIGAVLVPTMPIYRHDEVTGRIKDMIIRGGVNISAAEVENHLLAHPRVAAAAVVAVPDHRLGEKACAFVVARGQPPTLAELADFLRLERRIAPQKLPEMLQVIDALPTTMTGKVQKFLLRDQARALAEGVTGAR